MVDPSSLRREPMSVRRASDGTGAHQLRTTQPLIRRIPADLSGEQNGYPDARKPRKCEAFGSTIGERTMGLEPMTPGLGSLADRGDARRRSATGGLNHAV